MQGQWRTHPGNQFNKDQGGPPNRPPQQGPSLYDRTTKLEETLAQFMQVSMSNQKSTKSTIKNLEVQVGQLAKQLADRPSSSFGANLEKNPKEECKVVMTRRKMVSMNEGEKRIGEEKQQLVIEPEINPVVEPLSETEEEVEAEDDQQKEIPIIVMRRKRKKKKERKKRKMKKMKKKKRIREKKRRKRPRVSWLEKREKRKEASPSKRDEVSYPMVPTKKYKERHLACFLDIFKKLEITMPFGEALQQMPLYSKFLKDKLTRKNKIELEFYYGYNVLVLIRVRWPNRGLSGGMAPRKRKATSLVSQAGYDRSRFVSQEAWDHYSDNVLVRNILPERNVKLYINEFDDFRRELIRRNWDKQLTNLTEGSIDVAIMKEFCTNLYVPDDKSHKKVRVQGHLIKFDVDSLNTFLETPVVVEQGESLPSYSRFVRLRPDPQELTARLCIPGRGFVLNAEGLLWKLLRKDLTTLAQTWSVLSYSNLALTSHTSDLNLDRAKLVYGLVMKMNMNLGSLIFGQISLIAQSNSLQPGFPALIIALCKARGVTSDSLTFESLSPAINLAYIKKNCWNMDEPSVTFPGTQKSRARRSKAPSTLAAPTSPTSSPSTSALTSPPAALVLSGPSIQSSEPSLSMLQSLHQGQLLIMQSLHDMTDPVAATLQVTPEPSIAVLDMSSSQTEPSAPVLDLPLPQDSSSSTHALDLNEHAMDSAQDH
ncbi:hypothetical protein HKD37_17G048048 [Glycine soja]